MNDERFFRNSSFRQYLNLLRNLHELIRNTADESPAGEILREMMDGPAELLTPEEIECINGISGDLYLLSKEYVHQPLPMTETARSSILEALNARNSGDFAKSIRMLREAQGYLELWQLSYVRGSTLLEAGAPLPAADCFLRAWELCPQNHNFRFMWLTALSQGNPEAAKAEADKILMDTGNYPAKLVYKAADTAFASTRELTTAEGTTRIKVLIPVLENTILRLQISGEAVEDPSTLAAAISLLGFCHEHLGNNHAAIRYFDQGLSLFPSNDALRVARGIQLYGTKTEESIVDFVFATQLQTRLVWPYLFLAHYYLTKGRITECLRYAGEALQRSPSNVVAADCLEWIAICQAMSGHPPNSVEATFGEALRLAPNNERIKQNQALFKERLASTAQKAWIQISDHDLREFGRKTFVPLAA